MERAWKEHGKSVERAWTERGKSVESRGAQTHSGLAAREIFSFLTAVGDIFGDVEKKRASGPSQAKFFVFESFLRYPQVLFFQQPQVPQGYP